MIVVGFVIVISFDPIIQVTHSVLKMFMSFLGIVLIVVGNMGVIIDILDHRKKQKKGAESNNDSIVDKKKEECNP